MKEIEPYYIAKVNEKISVGEINYKKFYKVNGFYYSVPSDTTAAILEGVEFPPNVPGVSIKKLSLWCVDGYDSKVRYLGIDFKKDEDMYGKPIITPYKIKYNLISEYIHLN